jgi:hypothetical protein
MSARLFPVLALTALGGLGCSGRELPAPPAPAESVQAVYVVPAALADLDGPSFFDHPWPSDLRLENGTPRFLGYYNPKHIAILDQYIEAMNGEVDGFSPIAAGYVRFSAALDPSSLPADPKAGLAPDASIQLIDIDPASPERGTRKLVSLSFREQEGVYWRPNTLAFMPVLGLPLRTHTRYALVATDALRGASGGRVEASQDLLEVLGRASSSSRTEAARQALAPALEAIEAAGVSKERLVQLAVFTTADPTAELFAARDDLRAHVAAPTVDSKTWANLGGGPDYDEFYGVFGPSPNYQEGVPPYATFGSGGGFKIEGGHPVVVDTFDLRFSLTVPNAKACPMPESGYPIVLYAHGTGGDFRSYLMDGTAAWFAKSCIASMGVDQIFHGMRPGAPDPSDPSYESELDILYFNFQNVVAARHNAQQSALDDVQRARLFTESHITVPASVSARNAPIAFDPARVLFFGHSQGGHDGPLYFAADDSARGGVLSGSGALIAITLLEKTNPKPSVASLVKTVFLGLGSAEQAAELSVFHPAISLAQAVVDVVDPLNYARAVIAEPRQGFDPKSVYMTEGVNPDGSGDSYAPPHGIEAHSLAMGLPLQSPGVHAIAEAAWGGPGSITISPDGVSGNLASGKASGVLAQWGVPPGDDGHFVVFDVLSARKQSTQFLRNLADDPKGRVPAP